MSPEVLASLEGLAARRARERSVGGVDSLVKSHGRRVFEPLAAVTTLALVDVGVTVEVVLLEMHAQFEANVALLAAIRPLLPTQVHKNTTSYFRQIFIHN